MSKTQNKKKTAQKIHNDVKNYWEKEVLPEEIIKLSNSVSIYNLDKKTQRIIKKVESKEDLNSDELKYIKKVLANYREAINKHDVEGTVESINQHKRHIKTQQDLVALFDNEDDDRFHIKMQFPIDGILTLFEFDVKPITDIQAVNLVMDHANLFEDLTENEISLFNKETAGQEITEEEQQVIEEAKRKILELETENQVEIMNKFLARQLTPQAYDNVEDNINKFWKKFPFLERMSLYLKVRDILGLTERANEELFLA